MSLVARMKWHTKLLQCAGVGIFFCQHSSPVYFHNMKRTRIITTKSDKSTFAHGGNSEKIQRSSKSAAIRLIKFESKHSHTVTSNIHILNTCKNMKYRHILKNQSKKKVL